jgi:hypothetical protein
MRGLQLGVMCCLSMLLLSIAPGASAQDLLYDDGGDHELSEYGALRGGSVVEVRDGPGNDPTHLDVTINDFLYDVDFRAYEHSSAALQPSIGGATLSTYGNAVGTIDGSFFAENNANSWGSSQLTASSLLSFSTANESSTFTFTSGSNAILHRGYGGSTTIMLGGGTYDTQLFGSAVMQVHAGFPGQEGTLVTDDAYLEVLGGNPHSEFGFAVRERGLADIHSGSSYSAQSLSVADQGTIRLFGQDFLIDGIPVGFGDITALSGGATRSGNIQGTLESGHLIDMGFSVSDAGILRLAPVPPVTLPMLTPLGLGLLGALLSLAGARRLRS